MKGNGNGWSTLLKKLYFMFIPTSGGRTKFIIKHSHEFKHVGGGIFWQPRTYPTDPELISIGNNVMLASGVDFTNHDIIAAMLNRKYNTNDFVNAEGCISIGDNVMIGANTMILPNVRIGSNVIIGAGSIVAKYIPDNSVAAGIPCKVIGDFDTLVEKYRKKKKMSPDELWMEFERKRD